MNAIETTEKISIGVSSCLLGNRVRYDGDHQYQPVIKEYFSDHFMLVAFCPEIEIGLGVPRAKIQLIERDTQIICVDQLTETKDYTRQLSQCCDSQSDWLKQISGYILKTKSPSCGLTKVKTRFGDQIKAIGQGIFARELLKRLPNLPMIEEDQLHNIEQRNTFINRVLRFKRTTS